MPRELSDSVCPGWACGAAGRRGAWPPCALQCLGSLCRPAAPRLVQGHCCRRRRAPLKKKMSIGSLLPLHLALAPRCAFAVVFARSLSACATRAHASCPRVLPAHFPTDRSARPYSTHIFRLCLLYCARSALCQASPARRPLRRAAPREGPAGALSETPARRAHSFLSLAICCFLRLIAATGGATTASTGSAGASGVHVHGVRVRRGHMDTRAAWRALSSPPPSCRWGPRERGPCGSSPLRAAALAGQAAPAAAAPRGSGPPRERPPAGADHQDI
jgi:hypothetical protein